MRQAIEESKKEAVRQAILKAARGIIEKEGVEKISIRRLAQEIGYSPGSIYQYFKDKEAIVTTVIETGYKNLMRAVMSESVEGHPPEEQIKRRFKAYASAVLTMPFYYKKVMFTDNSEIVKQTSVLDREAIEKRPAFIELMGFLETGKAEGAFSFEDTALYAQLIWTSVFGMLSRAIIERVDRTRTLWYVEKSVECSLAGIKTQ